MSKEETPVQPAMTLAGPGEVTGAGQQSDVAKAAPGPACERLTVVVEFDQPMDRSALTELLDAVRIYGAVKQANHQVLRRSKRALV